MTHTRTQSGPGLALDAWVVEQAFRCGQRAERVRGRVRAAQRSAADSIEKSAVSEERAQRYTRKQPNCAILVIGRNARSTRLATARSHKMTTGWLSSCDKWQKVTRRPIPPRLRANADDSQAEH
jgi:hypothetical protein